MTNLYIKRWCGMTTAIELLDEASRILSAEYESEFEAAVAVMNWCEKAEDKFAAIYYARKRMTQEIELLKSEEKRLVERRRSIERIEEHLEIYAVRLLLKREELGLESKIKTPIYTASLSEASRVVGPENDEDWPEQACITVKKPSKTLAKTLIESGVELDGVRIEKTKTLRMR